MTPENLSRRTLLRRGATGAGLLAAGALLPGTAFARSGRPVLTHGVQLGDPRPDGAVVWTRADRPSRMFVEISAREDFRDALRVPGPALTPETDGTG